MNRADESSMSRPHLPRPLVVEIFQTMQGNYGSRFLNQWRTGQIIDGGEHHGKDAGLVNAMAFWGMKLAGFADKPECIRRVLNRLPPDPPSLPQFAELCSQAPANEKPAIQHKLTSEDHQRMADAAREAKRAVEKASAEKVEFWATHPRSAKHLRDIFDAAKKVPKFQACIDEMVANGICTREGKLLKRYAGMSEWQRV